MANYLVVVGDGNADKLFTTLSNKVKPYVAEPTVTFEVPHGHEAPKFGSFDALIKLTDDLQKHDSATEGVLRRIERQWVELDDEKNKADFQVNEQSVAAFLKNGWTWDNKRYPTTRTFQANLDFLLESVQKLDEQLRTNAQAHSDIKSQKTAVARRDAATFPTRDLIDLLVPSEVSPEDFVETKHLTTVIVILARGQDKEFEAWYEQPKFTFKKSVDGKEVEQTDEIPGPKTVIPTSLKQFTSFKEGKEDKDGNTVWRVVLFRSCKDKFVSLARQNKFIVRDFTYDEAKFTELNELRSTLQTKSDASLNTLRMFSKAAWGDVFVAWLHLKSMRACVEATLRYGQKGEGFAGFIVAPKPGAPVALRKELAGVLGKGVAVADAADADGEEFFSYVSLNFAPRAAMQ